MKPSKRFVGVTNKVNKVAHLPEQQRRELFAETAAKMKSVPAIAEKDFWVVWVLDKLFSHPRLKSILQFKGGTSLSKVFNLIGRFSEDIDLILDWREITNENPTVQRSKNQQEKFNHKVNQQAKIYIEKTILPEVSVLLAPICVCELKEDGFSIAVHYPSLFTTNYLKSEVLLEIGPLAAWSPSATFEVKPYSAIYFPAVFEKHSCEVPTILARRTFWEKATILHQEVHREAGKPMPSRYSRHYYDLALLAQSTIKKEALADPVLLREVVQFKQQFYPSTWARYDMAKPSTLRLIPADDRIKAIADDFDKMQVMIYDKVLSLDDIIETLRQLEQEINSSKSML